MGRMVTVTIEMDEEDKKKMEKVCADMGLTINTAFMIFAKKVSREYRIPFEVCADPFYSESNLRHIDKLMQDVKEGRAHFAEHDLIEDD